MLPRRLAWCSLAAHLLVSCGGRSDLVEPFDSHPLAPTAPGSEGGHPDAAADVPAGATCSDTCAGQCSAGGCLVTLIADPNLCPDGCGTALDATTLYLADPRGIIMKMPKSGGTVTTLAGHEPSVGGMVVDATNVYWCDGLTPQVMVKVPIAGGATTTMTTGGFPSICATALDSTNLYWVNARQVEKFALFGSSPMPIALASHQDSPVDIKVDATDVYWVNENPIESINGSVVKVPIAGGAPTTLASHQAFSLDIALDESFVYWVNAGSGTRPDGSIMRIAKGGGTPTTLVANREPYYFALDATNIYWSEFSEVLTIPKGGGTPSTLSATGNALLAADETGVYWTPFGSVVRWTRTCACR